MRYVSGNTMRHGTVWCPGPVANSIWVLDDENGEPVVVKMLRGKLDNAHRDSWTVAKGMSALAGKVDPNPDYRGDWHRDEHTGTAYVPQDMRPYVARSYFRQAPRLSEKVWRRAVGDQCVQLELDAA